MAKNAKNKTKQPPKQMEPARTKPKKRRQKKKGARNPLSAITSAGTAFLKASMCPSDFTSDEFSGIPDEMDCDVVTREFKLVGNLQTYTTGYDVYYVMLPIPGYSYFWGQRAAGGLGAITLTGVPYAGVNTLIPTGSEATNVTAFRLASNVIEIIPTVNAMTWSGSMQTFKGKVSMGGFNTAAVTGYYPTANYIEGLEILNGFEPNEVYSFNKGCMMPSFNTSPKFDFVTIPEGITWAEMTTNQAVSPAPVVTFQSVANYNFYGLGSLECTVIKLPALAASQTAVIRTWQTVEFQVNSSSIIYDYRHLSPSYDPVALALLKRFKDEHPGSVDYAHNTSFWENFQKWCSDAANIAKDVGKVIEVGSTLLEIAAML